MLRICNVNRCCYGYSHIMNSPNNLIEILYKLLRHLYLFWISQNSQFSRLRKWRHPRFSWSLFEIKPYSWQAIFILQINLGEKRSKAAINDRSQFILFWVNSQKTNPSAYSPADKPIIGSVKNTQELNALLSNSSF